MTDALDVGQNGETAGPPDLDGLGLDSELRERFERQMERRRAQEETRRIEAERDAPRKAAEALENARIAERRRIADAEERERCRLAQIRRDADLEAADVARRMSEAVELCKVEKFTPPADLATADRMLKAKWLMGVGCPKRVALAACLGYVETTDAVRAARRVDRDLLVLSGPPGCGKSVAAAMFLADSPLEGRWVWSMEMNALALRDNENKFSAVFVTPVLVLDDIGVEYLDPKGFLSCFMDRVITGRHAEMLTTIITTNLNGERFKARYGSRIVDRLSESGGFVEIAGDSMRGA